MTAYKTVIFCQAPADLKYALEIYGRCKADGPVLFVTVEVEGMKQFLELLQLPQADLIHLAHPITAPSLRRWGANLALRNWMRKIFEKYFREISGANVYYFSNEIDWVAPSCVAFLSRRNKVVWCPHHKYTCVHRTCSLKLRLLLHLYQWVSGAQFTWRKIEGSPLHQHTLWFRHEQYGVLWQPITGEATEVLETYAQHLPLLGGQRKALVFENPEENISDDYEAILKQVVTMLVDAGNTVLVKPHPRAGCSPFIRTCAVHLLPSYIPGEFLPVRQFTLVLGGTSSALGSMASACSERVVSLAKLFHARDQGVLDYGINYVSKVAGGRLRFVNTLEELQRLIIEQTRQAK